MPDDVCRTLGEATQEVEVLAAVFGARHFIRLRWLMQQAAAAALCERERCEAAS